MYICFHIKRPSFGMTSAFTYEINHSSGYMPPYIFCTWQNLPEKQISTPYNAFDNYSK